MSLLRCSRSLFRPPNLAPRVGSRPYVGSIARLCRADFQTRGKHNRPSHQAPHQPVPRHLEKQQPSLAHNQETINNEILFDANTKGYQDAGEEPRFPNVKVRFLRPAIYALTFSFAIYVNLAYFEAKKELKPRSINDFVQQWQPPRRAPPTPTEVVTRAWDELSPMSKLSLSIIGGNSAVYLTKLAVPNFWRMLWHIPAANVNYSLFTSTFVHSGPMHLGVNMWACYNFLPAVGYSKLFRGDTNHMISFFLAGGLLSGYAQHVASAIFTRGRAIPPMFIPSGGASGALFAILGAFCTQYPQHGIGIIFVPFYADAQYVLPAIMLFDLVGMVRGYSFVNLGHAAHLAGASLGVAYSYLDGHGNLWRPLVEFWKRRL